MFEIDREAYASASRREKVQYLLGLYGRIVGYLFLAIILLLVFSPDPLSLISVGIRANARRASCQSNYKQLGLALWEYSEDNDGYLPATKDAKSGKTWREELYPFVRSTGVYICPDDHSDYSRASSDILPHSYGASIIGGGKGIFNTPGSRPTKWANADQVIAMTDMRGYIGPEWDITNPLFLPATSRELYVHVPRHLFYEHPGGTLNCLFADGHIKAMKPMATLAPVNLWTGDNAPFVGQDLQIAQAILTHAEGK